MGNTHRWMSARVAAEYADVSVKLIYRAINDRELRAIRIGAGRHVRTNEDWVNSWLEGLAEGGTQNERSA